MNSLELLERIRRDPRYQENLLWGEPRDGHPEGTLAAHIEDLEQNLERLEPRLTGEQVARLRVLIHVHDIFKPQARAGAAIEDPQSHASLARSFLAELDPGSDLLEMLQYHDENYALWRHHEARGRYDPARLERLLARIPDWELFLWFLVIDGCTTGKSRQKLEWFLDQIEDRIEIPGGLREAVREMPEEKPTADRR